MFRFLCFAFFTLVFAQVSSAASKNSIISECMKAIDDSDNETIQEQANEIMKWTNLFSDELKIKGAECLEAAKGEPFIYDASQKSFVSGDAVYSAVSPQEARRIEQEFNQAKRRLEDAIDNLSTLNAELIQNEIYQACSLEYAQNSTQTMLNQICINSFSAKGHPKLEEVVSDDGQYLRAKENYDRVLLKTLGLR